MNWLKMWTVDEFNTDCYCYIAEANSGAGVLYAVTDTTATTLTLSGSPANGTATFCMFKLVATDITSGMTSGNKILTLRDTDTNLKAFAIPATSDATGAAAYGKNLLECYQQRLISLKNYFKPLQNLIPKWKKATTQQLERIVIFIGVQHVESLVIT